MEIAKYQFHSWTRKGISGSITEPDDLGAGTSTVKERAGIILKVSLNGAPVPKNFELMGPGDIIGLNPDMIVRTSPRNRITSFEPNYLPLVEFYDEDFLWRYTPAAPTGEKLRPWLFLLILKEEEFERTKRGTPLGSITVKTPDAFPPATETWLWAHVHNDMNLPAAALTNFVQFVDALNSNADTDPDQLYCRLLSPRKLDANTAYYGFLIPSFETGRLAGIGAAQTDIDKANAQAASWSATGANGEMPVYFEWYFRTGANEDFESLVKKLKPQDMDPKVGIRDMDSSAPGFVKADGTVPFPGTSPAILGLEGALKSPATVSTVFPSSPTANDFQVELQKIVNLPFKITGQDISGDPIISVPLYGNMHAKTSAADVETLDITKTSWLHDLNKDPRTRVSAGLGTLVVQKNQERYMQQAWSQVENIIEANKRIKNTLLYMKVAGKFATATFSKLSPTNLISISKPVLSRIMGSPTTIYQQIKDSQLPVAAFAGTFRRLIVPNRRIAKLLGPVKKVPYETVVAGLNAGTLTAAPAKGIPAGALNLQDISAKLAKLPAKAGTVTDNKTAANQVADPKKQLSSLAAIPARNTFALVLSDETKAPVPIAAPAGADNAEAKNYRKALTDMTKRLAVQAPQQVTVSFDLNNAFVKVSAGIDPARTFPRRLSSLVKFPGSVSLADPANVYAAMAYPDIEEPVYKGLAAISSELLLPNLKLIPDNCISLLNTNPKFIESYMVGLNHEMGRELLWREYPTDQRGSYFRQFWDVSGIIAPPTDKTPAQQAAAFKDITPIDTWGPNSALGSHNNRGTQDEKQLVLVIRGELLNKYPVIITAQKAIADGTGTAINTSLPDADFLKSVKFPLYKADVPPDIKFFGFDLTADQATGKVLTPGFTDTLGWYFVLMQVPGTPTFGMDISFSQGDGPLSWDDLSWDKFPAGTGFIKASVPPQLSPPGSVWGADAASMADILFQQPVMVAIHAKEMLANLTV